MEIGAFVLVPVIRSVCQLGAFQYTLEISYLIGECRIVLTSR